jgi:hypothetical protein
MSENQNDKLTSSETSPAQQNGTETFGPVIHTYSRKMALADGVQVDVSGKAREAGFKFPVFLTEAVHSKYVQVPEGVECQDEEGRLWDILVMLHYAIKRASGGVSRVVFQLYVRNTNGKPRKVVLVAECGAMDFDDPAPCITVMLPGED